MRRQLVLSGAVLFVLFCFTLVVSVNAASVWSHTYGQTGISEHAYSIISTSDGGYALAGSTRPTNVVDAFGVSDDFLLVKTDALGNMQWNKTYGGWGTERAYSVVETPDGGFALTGKATPFGAGLPPNYSYTFCLVKTDSFGNQQWNKTYGGGTTGSATSLVAAPDGGYAIAGNPFLIKTDTLGNVEWNRTYPVMPGWFMGTWSVVATPDSGYAIAGTSMADLLLIKTDSFGYMQWSKTYGGPEQDSANSLIATSDGGYAIAGTWNQTDYARSGGTEADFYLVKTDAFGNMEWNRAYPIAGTNYANSVVETPDGGFALVGYSYSPDAGADCLLIKTNSLGYMQWNKTYGGTESDIAESLVSTPDHGYAIAGSTSSFDPGSGDFWLVKTDELGVVPEYTSLLVPALVLTAIILINKKRLYPKP